LKKVDDISVNSNNDLQSKMAKASLGEKDKEIRAEEKK
jgi:hypothetical protein